jgi:hypothetical protein
MIGSTGIRILFPPPYNYERESILMISINSKKNRFKFRRKFMLFNFSVVMEERKECTRMKKRKCLRLNNGENIYSFGNGNEIEEISDSTLIHLFLFELKQLIITINQI